MTAQIKSHMILIVRRLTYKTKILLTLSTFKNVIEAKDGTYDIYIELTELDGATNIFPAKTITVDSLRKRHLF